MNLARTLTKINWQHGLLSKQPLVLGTCSNFSRLLSGAIQPESTYKNCIKIAIIGSGPAGFYTAQALLKRPDIAVDIYEKLPVPFGLIRYGVAPDHPEVKNVINSFTETALKNRVAFLGNVAVGNDVLLDELRSAYNAVVLCYGSAQDKWLGIPGETLPNVVSARKFVGWYNGLPEENHLEFNLNTDTAVIIGHGNVALDCARILLSNPEEVLKETDIAEHALNALRKSQIKRVFLVGRRGPLQVSYTIKEFREMTKIKHCRTNIDPKDVEHITDDVLKSFERPRKRITELMIKTANNEPPSEWERECLIKFLRSPKEIRGNENDGVQGVDFVVNSLEGDPFSPKAKAKGTGETEFIPCGLVLRSIGYKTILIDPKLPFDEKKGTIKNEHGRVIDSGPGLYCSGWASTGATGVINTTMLSSFDVARTILKDFENGVVTQEIRPGRMTIIQQLLRKDAEIVLFKDWQKIDMVEKIIGSSLGKPREKMVDIKEMIRIAKEYQDEENIFKT